MFPSTNALNDNLARSIRVRNSRIENSLTRGATPGRMIGGPAVDPAWDAFFGGMQTQEDAANAAGLGFTTSFRNFGRSSSPAISGLRNAVRR